MADAMNLNLDRFCAEHNFPRADLDDLIRTFEIDPQMAGELLAYSLKLRPPMDRKAIRAEVERIVERRQCP